MVRHGGSSAGSYLADPTSPIPSHCASIVVTSTLRVKRLELHKQLLQQKICTDAHTFQSWYSAKICTGAHTFQFWYSAKKLYWCPHIPLMVLSKNLLSWLAHSSFDTQQKSVLVPTHSSFGTQQKSVVVTSTFQFWYSLIVSSEAKGSIYIIKIVTS